MKRMLLLIVCAVVVLLSAGAVELEGAATYLGGPLGRMLADVRDQAEQHLPGARRIDVEFTDFSAPAPGQPGYARLRLDGEISGTNVPLPLLMEGDFRIEGDFRRSALAAQTFAGGGNITFQRELDATGTVLTKRSDLASAGAFGASSTVTGWRSASARGLISTQTAEQASVMTFSGQGTGELLSTIFSNNFLNQQTCIASASSGSLGGQCNGP